MDLLSLPGFPVDELLGYAGCAVVDVVESADELASGWDCCLACARCTT